MDPHSDFPKSPSRAVTVLTHNRGSLGPNTKEYLASLFGIVTPKSSWHHSSCLMTPKLGYAMLRLRLFPKSNPSQTPPLTNSLLFPYRRVGRMQEVLFVFLLSHPPYVLARLLHFDIELLLFLLYPDTTLHHSPLGMRDTRTRLAPFAVEHFGSDLHSQLEKKKWCSYPT